MLAAEHPPPARPGNRLRPQLARARLAQQGGRRGRGRDRRRRRKERSGALGGQGRLQEATPAGRGGQLQRHGRAVRPELAEGEHLTVQRLQRAVRDLQQGTLAAMLLGLRDPAGVRLDRRDVPLDQTGGGTVDLGGAGVVQDGAAHPCGQAQALSVRGLEHAGVDALGQAQVHLRARHPSPPFSLVAPVGQIVY
jgi:hypothetical protein